MIKGIFFDLFGTLFVYGDMEKAWIDWMHYLYISLKKHSPMLTKEELSNKCVNFMGHIEPISSKPNLTKFEKRIDCLCNTFRINIDGSNIHIMADWLVDRWQEEIKLDKDAIYVLSELKKNYALALISNFDHPCHVRKLLSSNELDCFFESITLSGDIGIEKPDPAIFNRALSVAGLMPDEVAYVGDTDDDIISANSAGMKPVLINRKEMNSKNIVLDYNDDTGEIMNEETNKLGFEYRTISSLKELLLMD